MRVNDFVAGRGIGVSQTHLVNFYVTMHIECRLCQITNTVNHVYNEPPGTVKISSL